MIKLMKYEFRKQAFSKMVILSLTGLIELLFLYGFFASKENSIALSLGLLSVFAFGAFFFIAFESIITYSNDLKNKQSYMLFLTPNSCYTIVGAKVLTAGIQVLLAGIAFFAIFFINGVMLISKYGSIEDVRQMILGIIRNAFQLEIKFTDVLSVMALLILSWISTITAAFFSITLSTTFLADKKFKGFVSFSIYIILNVLFNEITKLILGNVVKISVLDNLTLYFTLESILMLLFTVLTYVGTAWMLEKKVSV